MRTTLPAVALFLGLISCQKENPNQESFVFEITPVGETGVSVDWAEMNAFYTVRFLIDVEDLFDSPMIVKEVEASKKTIYMEGLSPLTKYNMRIEVWDEQEIIWSEIESFTSLYTNEVIRYMSTDQVELCANLAYISTSLSNKTRVVVFMHEFSKSKSSWYVTGLVDTLIKDGNLCLAIDFRGHGCSGFEGDVLSLIDEPWMLREDFDATIACLDTLGLEHASDIIVLGASMGACVATAVSSYDQVIGGVAASAVKNISEKMLQVPLIPQGIFYIAGELDKNEGLGIDYEADAYSLHDVTEQPSKVTIIERSTEHGVGLLEANSALVSEALEWVRNL